MSTYYNPKFARSKTLEFATVDGEAAIDYFSPRTHTLIKGIRQATPYTFGATDKLVNISYRAYGTTSMWWVILVYNGMVHPYEITPGTVLQIPELFEVTRALGRTSSRVGQVVEI